MLKLAGIEDLPEIKRLSLTLIENSPYKNFKLDAGKIEEVIQTFLVANPLESVLLLSVIDGKTVGLLAGISREFKFSRERHATEVALWVDPEFRGSSGKELQEAFEYWAKKVGCKFIHMGLLEDKDLSKRKKLYKKQGYVPFEQAWVKEI